MKIVQANLDVGGVTDVVIDGKVYAIEDVKNALRAVDPQIVKNAERYCWLRDKSGAECAVKYFWADPTWIVDLDDGDIDAAMKAREGADALGSDKSCPST